MSAAQQRAELTGPRTPYELNDVLGSAARSNAPDLERADLDAIVDAAAAVAASGDDHDPVEVAELMAVAVGQSQTRARVVFPRSSGSVSWSSFGAVIPVLSGSAGAGASSVAVALADGLQQADRCTLLVDADEPARSGLACAATLEGPWTRPVNEQVSVRYSWRGDALLARLDTGLPAITPGMVPVPPDWLPDPAPDPLHATVVDLGHGGWRATSSPVYGPGGWLRRGLPAQRPVLVVRATRPSLRQAEQLLARLEPWVQRGVATPIFQLVVNGARRWPTGVTGVAGPRLSELLDDALFLPHQPGWDIAGVTDDPSPSKAVDALRPLLAAWGLIPSPRRR